MQINTGGWSNTYPIPTTHLFQDVLVEFFLQPRTEIVPRGNITVLAITDAGSSTGNLVVPGTKVETLCRRVPVFVWLSSIPTSYNLLLLFCLLWSLWTWVMRWFRVKIIFRLLKLKCKKLNKINFKAKMCQSVCPYVKDQNVQSADAIKFCTILYCITEKNIVH